MDSSALPTVISIHHDGVEVCRNEQGEWIPTATGTLNDSPNRVQFFFDHQLVYEVNNGRVEMNELASWLGDCCAKS